MMIDLVNFKPPLRIGAVGVTSLMLAGSAMAELSVGRTSSGGLGVGVGLGRVGAGASIGGSSVANAGVSVGRAASASTSVGGGSVADVDASVGRSTSASATVGGSSVANARANVGTAVGANVSVGSGSSLVDATVGVGSTTVGACVGSCTTPATTPGGTTTPTTPATTTTLSTMASAVAPVAPRRLPCASPTGNTTAFNGYPLTDKTGRTVGIIHSTQLGGDAKIAAVSIRTPGKSCVSLSKVAFSVAGYAIRGSFDGAKSGL